MQLKEFNILLDIKKHNKIEYVEVVQGDSNSNVFNITLVDGLFAYDLTNTDVEIVFSKSDGTTVQQTDIAVLNALEGKIQCVLKTNTIASPGKVLAEVRVLEGETLLTSTRFEFYVRKAIINDETVESTNEFPVLTQLIATTQGLIQQVEQIEKQVPEQVVTDLQAVSTLANQLETDLTTHKAENTQQFATKINKNGDIMEGFLQPMNVGELLDTSVIGMPVGSMCYVSGRVNQNIFTPILRATSNDSFMLFGRIGNADLMRTQILASCYIKVGVMFLDVIQGSETFIKAEGNEILIQSTAGTNYGRDYQFTILKIY